VIIKVRDENDSLLSEVCKRVGVSLFRGMHRGTELLEAFLKKKKAALFLGVSPDRDLLLQIPKMEFQSRIFFLANPNCCFFASWIAFLLVIEEEFLTYALLKTDCVEIINRLKSDKGFCHRKERRLGPR